MKVKIAAILPKTRAGISHFSFNRFPIIDKRAMPLLMSYKYFAVLSLCFLVMSRIITRKEGKQKAKNRRKGFRRLRGTGFYFGVNAPAASRDSTNLSMSPLVWVAIREMRNRLVPAGTVGGRIAGMRILL